MKGLFLLKKILQKNDYMCKIDLKDAYFAVPLHSSSQKYIKFKWKGNLHQFLCLYFGLSSGPTVFTKFMKIRISVMRELNVRLIIFLDDILLMTSTKKELIQARNTLIFLLQTLGFLINKNKSVFNSCQFLQFLGVEINSKEINVSLPQEKKDKIISQYQGILKEKSVSTRELTLVLVRLSSTVIAVLTAALQYRAIQRQQIAELANTKNFDSMIEPVSVEPATKRRENLDKFRTPSNNINRCFIGRLKGLLRKSKDRGTLDISGKQRSCKCFGIEGSKACNFNFFSLASQS